ncbi:T-cell surface glycoprotein CD3 zeta chain-like [Astyanax mexicanus]|uniref:T-cell surface glycoprotein CD3 zeta chain-like n=1 Tax=Astyanax mexicanus TaxID=7994 RepID=A0A8T2LGC4_ASTMX|nr:T-cell surface glycoprotein CD3 zeta chain-like [Astyanax mexicanus]
MSLSDPVTCYILDAVLLLYCIIFTALYFRIKFARIQSDTSVPQESVYEGLNKNAMTDEYETLAGQSGQAGGPVRRNRVQQEEGQYEALRSPSNDDYQEIPKKAKVGVHFSTVFFPQSAAAADAIEMDPLPALPSRS